MNADSLSFDNYLRTLLGIAKVQQSIYSFMVKKHIPLKALGKKKTFITLLFKMILKECLFSPRKYDLHITMTIEHVYPKKKKKDNCTCIVIFVTSPLDII